MQFSLSDNFFALYFMTFDLACLVVFSLTALLIFWRRSDDWMAMFTSLALVTFGASYTFFLFELGRSQSPESVPLTLVQALGLGSSIIFYYLFPNGRFIPQWTRILAIVYVPWALTWLISPAASLLHWPFLLSYVVIAVFYGSGVVAQLYRYRHVSDAIERQQTKLVVFGVTVTAVGLSGFGLVRLLSPAILSPTLTDMVGIPFIVLCQLFVPVTRRGRFAIGSLIFAMLRPSMAMATLASCRKQPHAAAVRLMKTGQFEALTAVAHALGFHDQSHFIRDIKAFSCMTPTSLSHKADDFHHGQAGYFYLD